MGPRVLDCVSKSLVRASSRHPFCSQQRFRPVQDAIQKHALRRAVRDVRYSLLVAGRLPPEVAHALAEGTAVPAAVDREVSEAEENRVVSALDTTRKALTPLKRSASHLLAYALLVLLSLAVDVSIAMYVPRCKSHSL